jgi:hypothetical protein
MSFLSFSQGAQKATFEFGPRFGLTVSELSGADNLMSVRASIAAGLMAEYKLKPSFALYTELNYSRQGAADRGDLQGVPFDNRIDLDYINVPLLLKFYIYEGLAIEAGPQLGFLLNAKYRSKQVENPLVRDLTNDFEGLDVSLGLGTSYKTEWGFIVGARYNFGLNTINNNTDFDSGDLRNAVFQLHFGYLFN